MKGNMMKKNLLTRLNEGPIICAEGYLFAMERRGYLSAGGFVPEVVLEHPEVVTQLHREFIRAGSDVVQAFTYYGHREKLRIIGKEELLEPLQKNAHHFVAFLTIQSHRRNLMNLLRHNVSLTIQKMNQFLSVLRVHPFVLLSLLDHFQVGLNIHAQ